MKAFKVVTTVLLAIIIATMIGVVFVNAKKSEDKDVVIVAGIFTAVQIMAIAGMWL